MFDIKEETIKAQSMFNSELYPTPDNTIQLMIDALGISFRWLKNRKVLDPSAGLGNILDLVKARCYPNDNDRHYNDRYNRDRNEDRPLYACEINAQAQAVLREKRYKMLESDFFAFNGDGHKFDVILMNPPFSNGIKHLLHAWNVVASGGTKIACLLNAENLKNPNSKDKQLLLSIIDEHGSWESIGQPFKNAERRTAVEVALVTLQKPEEDEFVQFDVGDYDKDAPQYQQVEFGSNLPVSGSHIAALVARYDATVAQINDIFDAESAIKFYTTIDDKDYPSHKRKNLSLDVLVSASRFSVKNKADVIMEIKKHFWGYVFHKTDMERFMTSAVREQFNDFVESNKSIAFTVSNIKRAYETLMLAGDEIIKQCILSTFDTFTSFHEKNKVHHEGWVTNKAWKLNDKKIIYPRAMKVDWQGIGLDYGNDKPLNDLDVVMCHLSGTAVNDITYMRDAIKSHCRGLGENGKRHDAKIESTFFYLRCYKKGTVHVYPKDKNLWNQLNITVAQYRNWIGDGS